MTTNVFPLFAFNDQQLRGIKIDGEPWFVAADVCRCLKLNILTSGKPNVTVSTAGLDDDEKGIGGINTPGGRQKMTIISRPGLFKLIQRSNKPEAKAFDRYVRHEVLPQIMDTGAYIGKDADVEAALERQPENSKRTDFDLMKTVMSAMQALQERIDEMAAEAEAAASPSRRWGEPDST